MPTSSLKLTPTKTASDNNSCRLEQALQSGDVSAAESAYTTIQNNLQSATSGQNALSGASLRHFQAIGAALQSGNACLRTKCACSFPAGHAGDPAGKRFIWFRCCPSPPPPPQRTGEQCDGTTNERPEFTRQCNPIRAALLLHSRRSVR